MGVELANGVEGKKNCCRGKVEVTEKKRENVILKSGGVHLKRNEVNRCDRRRRFKGLK